MKHLNLILEKLITLDNKFKKNTINYDFPKLWLNDESTKFNNPYQFFIHQIKSVRENKFSNNKLTYNLFIRYDLAYNHNISANIKNFDSSTFNQNGSLLKAIALIPYLQKLNINILHILPINSIGTYNKKGNLGSPYSIKNQYKIDDNLNEEFLEIDIEILYKAFIELLHYAGIKLIQEFVFRTSSLDSDLALTNPEYFYWIKETNSKHYKPPVFSQTKIKKIKAKIDFHDFKSLLAPDENYIKHFTTPPKKVARVDEKIIGLLEENNHKKSNEVTIPSAFADWPPDDNQPLWSDVTYLKLHNHPKFNYMAYNTIRMYDNELHNEKHENTALWTYIHNILPFWIEKFGIDGAMIDMGHALPLKLRNQILIEAKKINPEFIFWEENFMVTEESKKEGYDACLGYLIFDSLVPSKYREIIWKLSQKDYPIEFFLTPENHNTKRAMAKCNDKNFSICCYLINSFLPAINYIHSGFELSEVAPVNTGLGFEDEDLKEINTDNLPLFSEAQMNWNGDNIIQEIIKINQVRNELGEIEEIKIIDTEFDELIVFLVKSNLKTYRIIVNLSNNIIDFDIDKSNILFSNFEIEKTLNPYQAILSED